MLADSVNIAERRERDAWKWFAACWSSASTIFRPVAGLFSAS